MRHVAYALGELAFRRPRYLLVLARHVAYTLVGERAFRRPRYLLVLARHVAYALGKAAQLPIRMDTGRFGPMLTSVDYSLISEGALGSRVFVDYGVDAEPTHKCKPLLKCHGSGVHANDYIVLTPGGDVYAEQLACPPFRSILLGDGRVLPPGLCTFSWRPVHIFSENGLLAPESLAGFGLEAERELRRIHREDPDRYAVSPVPQQVLVEAPVAGGPVVADVPEWYRDDVGLPSYPNILVVHEGARARVEVSAGVGDQSGQEVPLDVVRRQGVLQEQPKADEERALARKREK